MNLVVKIPDTLAARLGASGPALERRVLEALVLEGVRAGRMTVDDVREALGFEVLDQVDGFLKTHGVFEPHTAEDVNRQVERCPSLADKSFMSL